MSNRNNEQIGRSRNPLPPQVPEQQPKRPQQSVQQVGNCVQGQQRQTKKKGQRDG